MTDGRAWEGERVLVTGGAGFIGSHLVDALVKQGAKVRVLDNLETGRRDNLDAVADRIDWMVGDVRDEATCRRACAGTRVVFHQAALGSVPRSIEEPALTFDVNVGGTARLFTAARDAGITRVVYASSSAVYGDSARSPKREGEEGEPLSPYGLSKRVDEQLASVFARCFGMTMVGLRYFNVYGPRQRPDGPYAAVIPRFVDACRRGEAPVIFGDGRQSRDFTFVGDVVEANLRAARAELDGAHVVNVGGGASITVETLARIVASLLGHTSSLRHEEPRAGDVQHSRADTRQAENVLGFRPTTGLERGLRATIASPQWSGLAGGRPVVSP
jgi:UDP-N-acetylglucosamine 4-epimerase